MLRIPRAALRIASCSPMSNPTVIRALKPARSLAYRASSGTPARSLDTRSLDMAAAIRAWKPAISLPGGQTVRGLGTLHRIRSQSEPPAAAVLAGLSVRHPPAHAPHAHAAIAGPAADSLQRHPPAPAAAHAPHAHAAITVQGFTVTAPHARMTTQNPMVDDYTLSHAVYTPEEVLQLRTDVHFAPKGLKDRAALAAITLVRKTFDLVTGYSSEPGKMTEEKYLVRAIFLETVAGVPGMVASMVRHFESLRLMRRDGGWIHTLLAEAENERMHLLTFLELKKPGPFMRLSVLLAQGIFFNGFFLAYLVSPTFCHRFVGYLEQEAVATYTHCLADLDAGRLPLWAATRAPPIAINYWRLPQDAMLKDVLLAIRADEAIHRDANHVFGCVGWVGGPPAAPPPPACARAAQPLTRAHPFPPPPPPQHPAQGGPQPLCPPVPRERAAVVSRGRAKRKQCVFLAPLFPPFHRGGFWDPIHMPSAARASASSAASSGVTAAVVPGSPPAACQSASAFPHSVTLPLGVKMWLLCTIVASALLLVAHSWPLP